MNRQTVLNEPSNGRHVELELEWTYIVVPYTVFHG
jgi:hypothetical protein